MSALKEVKVASEPQALLKVLGNPTYHFERIGLEAGPLSQWLFSALAEAELPVICVETRHMQAVLGGSRVSSYRALILNGFHAAVAVGSRVHRNSVPSTQMRCMMTASRRARATIAFFIPRRLAICMAQALSQDHFFERNILCAAS